MKAKVTKFRLGLVSGKTLYGATDDDEDSVTVDDCKQLDDVFYNLKDMNRFYVNARMAGSNTFSKHYLHPGNVEYIIFEWEPVEGESE